jgi:hypothetical protein
MPNFPLVELCLMVPLNEKIVSTHVYFVSDLLVNQVFVMIIRLPCYFVNKLLLTSDCCYIAYLKYFILYMYIEFFFTVPRMITWGCWINFPSLLMCCDGGRGGGCCSVHVPLFFQINKTQWGRQQQKVSSLLLYCARYKTIVHSDRSTNYNATIKKTNINSPYLKFWHLKRGKYNKKVGNEISYTNIVTIEKNSKRKMTRTVMTIIMPL